MRRLLLPIAVLLAAVALSGCSWPLHLHLSINPAAQSKLYHQTLWVMAAQRNYADAHQGHYAKGIFDLISNYPDGASLDGDQSPVVAFETSSDTYGYRVELADQDSGGAASFTVLVAEQGTVKLTCQGPAPLCQRGVFTGPASYYTLTPALTPAARKRAQLAVRALDGAKPKPRAAPQTGTQTQTTPQGQTEQQGQASPQAGAASKNG